MKIGDVKPGMKVKYRRQDGNTEEFEVKALIRIHAIGGYRQMVEVRGTTRRFQAKELEAVA